MAPSPAAHKAYHDLHSSAAPAVFSDTLLASLVSQHSADLSGGEPVRPAPTNGGADPRVRPEPAPLAPAGPKHASGRKRSSTACDKCRQKKIKCDNVKPRCGSCARNGIRDCCYSSETTGPDFWLLEMAYNGLASKLDGIMEELRGRGARAAPPKKRRTHASPGPGIPLWDASLTSLFAWPYLQEQLGWDPRHAARHVGRVVSACEEPSACWPAPGSVEEQLATAAAVEADFQQHFGSHLNAFLINSHTKVPFLDIAELVELLEVFTLIRNADPRVTVLRLLAEFHALRSTERVGACYSRALVAAGREDSRGLQKAYRNLCETMPMLLMVCAIGVISVPVSLDNIGTYENSLEERASMGAHKTPKAAAGPAAGQNRFALSQMYIAHAAYVTAVFPKSLRPSTIPSVKYHVLLSQYHHDTLNPSLAHEEIIIASTGLVLFIEKTRMRAGLAAGLADVPRDDALVNRLFWTCLKLECELRVEMCPHVPLSAITQITPPSSFFKIPDPFQEGDHTSESIRIANKYDDQNTWYYFLTEIALRKVENNMLDEVYRARLDRFLWDCPRFAKYHVWKLTIKYLNHLNSIVASLTPAIRKFVLMETDPAQIYASIKRKASRRKKAVCEEDQIPQILDDFLVDEDLLHHAQSEAVMFIKTRILSSKMILMRPLVYMCLHGQILFEEITEAAAEVLAQAQVSQPDLSFNEFPDEMSHSSSTTCTGLASERSIYLLAAMLNFLDNDDEDLEEGEVQQSYLENLSKTSGLEDFSDLVELAESNDGLEESYQTDYDMARKRVLKWFVAGLITIPKLTIPKLSLYRHPGSWYYIRNLVLGVILLFLMYRRTRDYVVNLMKESKAYDQTTNNTQSVEVLSLIFKKEDVQTLLEHALLVLDYWKEERKDCAVYGEYLRQCLSCL
ncbi:hypothetical protein METBIDRAFT_38474 [Metschnikowia bicuspidata var. bicuspidata NRRL YB-4993]|uniref:Zn(2)-C6 fungal-type domain-containing protein n=1 Tax=Metschnikowia bicuspidata var. bicuspidata NRRL YB-4993 TaxID=869754 RepID=A0A1A0HK48_9ASCO|nr:hypothetical protein METBIDRAFT_38474 [Metschnikowia bicuspidata var. bicuspidata NRRL YB-4993]OBA24262.1 hypothetical protein METBIDRAFT_38474 [Metschnikowia bicuspidata var. bicuspidata NRRL YB-4993]